MRFSTSHFILSALMPAVMVAAFPVEAAVTDSASNNAATSWPTTTLRVVTRVNPTQTFEDYAAPTMTPSSEPPAYSSDDEARDIHAEVQSLLELEQQALALETEINARKEALAGRLRQHRDQASLRDLLAQCDGLVCAAKVISQRICDKIGLTTEPSLAYARLEQQQALLPANDSTAITVPVGKAGNSTLPLYRPGVSNEPVSASDALPALVNVTTPWSALLSVLEIVASALGLVALVGFTRRRFFTSDRSRADRAADREERLTARAYRRAARRAEVRRRWTEMWQGVNCFGSSGGGEHRVGAMPLPSDTTRYEGYRRHHDRHHERRTGIFPFRTSSQRNNSYVPTSDYDEKRALILQDAFLEEQSADPTIAEKGQTMEAEIRELRHAHDMVRTLISRPSGFVSSAVESTLRLDTPQVDREATPRPPLITGASIVPPHNNPITTITATPSVIAALTPVTRSRASSTTLPPSYRSESLPDYTSRAGGRNPRTSVTFDDNNSDDDERSLLPTSSHNPYHPTISRHHRGRGRRSHRHAHEDPDAVFSLSYPSSDEEEIPLSPSLSTTSSMFFPHSESTLPPFSPRQRSRSLAPTTPASSIIETSTRPSGETLRFSGDLERRRSRSEERR